MNSIFHFKHFSLVQDNGVFKIGTDSMLLGAWAEMKTAGKILDVGCGTGVLGFMLMWKQPGSELVSLDISPEAIALVRQNQAQFPASGTMSVAEVDFFTWDETPESYTVLVCNPPYFKKGPQSLKLQQARHQVAFSFPAFWEKAFRLLKPDGQLFLVIPYDSYESEIISQKDIPFHIHHLCKIYAKPDTAPKRVLIEFGKKQVAPKISSLVLCHADGTYTDAYRHLTEEWHLHVPEKR